MATNKSCAAHDLLANELYFQQAYCVFTSCDERALASNVENFAGLPLP